MADELKIKLYAFTLDCRDPYKLAKFYAALLGWEIAFHDGEFACVGAPGKAQGAYPGIMFQRDPAYEPPIWPQTPGTQQQMQMAHLDFAVDDLEQAVRHAVSCGARPAEKQFSDGWRVMLDPAGHPFCLCSMKPIIDSPEFALL
ncbi:VOC family protein [Anaerotruncus colihominis]|uniref:VOC family protein n=1 Tax=Anaerotruncus colihominis TaxID=169435 RepID=UPI0026EBFDFC|nr:VOC family protein [Anaerotruncus colihominis]